METQWGDYCLNPDPSYCRIPWRTYYAMLPPLGAVDAQVRDTEISPELEKKCHDKEIRHLDSQLATVSQDIGEYLCAKDRVTVDYRHWRPKLPKAQS
ncbi:hypothetical protein N7463_003095 [Penicillium fimorum]|uniref:Uncharacterized protein n=1 Tax=Penicillium fimorum TaxID=1882269 RepID=A0A9X0C8Y6_9EURO|nr:hypothetical protein N7463_003095 [Penicillium fimorum]